LIAEATSEETRQRAVRLAYARLIWAWLQDDDETTGAEWRAAWDDLLVGDPGEDETRQDMIVGLLLDYVAGHLDHAFGIDEARERARVEVRRAAPVDMRLRSAMGDPASPALADASPVDEMFRTAPEA
jgi:hypothetical protein